MACLYSRPHAGQNHFVCLPEPSIDVAMIHWVSFGGMYRHAVLLQEYLYDTASDTIGMKSAPATIAASCVVMVPFSAILSTFSA